MGQMDMGAMGMGGPMGFNPMFQGHMGMSGPQVSQFLLQHLPLSAAPQQRLRLSQSGSSSGRTRWHSYCCAGDALCEAPSL